jgi:hypothetical protein
MFVCKPGPPYCWPLEILPCKPVAVASNSTHEGGVVTRVARASRIGWLHGVVSDQISSLVAGWLIGLGIVERTGRRDLPRGSNIFGEPDLDVPSDRWRRRSPRR